MSSWLDMLPANERQRIREKYKLSASAYEALREKVKGPKQLEQEMRRNEALAQLKFGLETEPVMKEALRSQIEKDISEHGIETVLDCAQVAPDIRAAIERGAFEVTVDEPSKDAPDHLVVVPEGNVTDRLPVHATFAESYVTGLRMA